MESPFFLKHYLDSRPVSAELENFISSLVALSGELQLQECDRQAQETFVPCVELCLADGTQTGLAFHGVSSGTSLLLLYWNAIMPQFRDKP